MAEAEIRGTRWDNRSARVRWRRYVQRQSRRVALAWDGPP
uniref:Uncharacterized protein n=1 Tax=Arundo donax TaxID=35708 RepID=A0A0A8YYY5_ARUDO